MIQSGSEDHALLVLNQTHQLPDSPRRQVVSPAHRATPTDSHNAERRGQSSIPGHRFLRRNAGDAGDAKSPGHRQSRNRIRQGEASRLCRRASTGEATREMGLPLLVALIGVGGSSASLAAFKPTAAVETAGIVAGAAAAMLLLAAALRRSRDHVGNRNADR